MLLFIPSSCKNGITASKSKVENILIIGFCILLRVILTVNNTFFFRNNWQSIFTKFTWWWPNIMAETCREYRGYIIKYFVNCCEKEGIIYSWKIFIHWIHNWL
jgi:hypothetical protein